MYEHLLTIKLCISTVQLIYFIFGILANLYTKYKIYLLVADILISVNFE